MSHLIFLPDRNTGTKHDWSGAFLPEAIQWQSLHGGQMVQVSQRLGGAGRRKAVLSAIHEYQPSVLAWFGHGLERSIHQMGFDSGNVEALAAAIAEYTTAPQVILYACSCADGPGPSGDEGFADLLRDALCREGAIHCAVWGHTTAGHTTQNPYVRVFRGPTPQQGGEWVVKPGGDHWARWQALLDGPLRFDFPLLTKDELRARLT
jgi:hypothetical protein